MDPVLEYRGREGKILYRNEEKLCYSPEDDWSVSIDDIKEADLRFLQSFRLKESYQLPKTSGKTGAARIEAINAIKEQLYNKKGVTISFYADTAAPVLDGEEQATKYISPCWAHYTYKKVDANHAATVIGWDDNYSRDNFAHKLKNGNDAPLPENDGAWLVKNSWGAETEEFPNRGDGNWGIEEDNVSTGYFWLSYEDKSIGTPETLDFDISNVEDDYLIYQHDYMPVNDVASAVTPERMSMANVFESEFLSSIEQVTCQTAVPGTTVHYDVYVLYDGAEDPTDGVKVAEAMEKAAGGVDKISGKKIKQKKNRTRLSFQINVNREKRSAESFWKIIPGSFPLVFEMQQNVSHFAGCLWYK